MDAPPDLLSRRIHFFTGKGGVGKTTVVAGLAASLARSGRRPLIVEMGHRASIAAIFGAEDVGYEPSELEEGIFACNVRLEPALAEYIGDHLPVRALTRLALRSRTLNRFFEAAPGVFEVAILHRLEKLAAMRLEAGMRFDPILVDLDASGHALMFFELPRVFAEIAGDGPLRGLLERVAALFRDPSTAALHLVTLPAELPVQETIELCERLRDQAAIELGAIIANRNTRPPLGADAAARVRREGPTAPGKADRELALRALRTFERQGRGRERLREGLGLPLIALPEIDALMRKPELAHLLELGDALGAAMAGDRGLP